MKKAISIIMIFILIFSMISCNNPSESNKSETEEDKIRSAVTRSAQVEFYGNAIGGNELKSSYATISTVRKNSENEYLVSGRMTMVDVYGTYWTNNFDCKVKKSESLDKWIVSGGFNYTSSNWSKG